MSQKVVKTCKFIDAPPNLLGFQLDELVIICLAIIVGIISELIIFTLPLGILLCKIYARFRNDRADGYLMHLLYHWGLMPMRGKRVFPNAFIKRWLP